MALRSATLRNLHPNVTSVFLTTIWLLLFGLRTFAQGTDLIDEAGKMVEANDFTNGLPLSLSAVVANPDSAIAHFYLGICHSGLDQCPDANLSFTNAIKLDPAFAEAYLERARCQYSLGLTDAALKDLRTALKIVPGFLDALLLRAEISLDDRDYSSALEDLDMAKRYAPRVLEVYTLRAELFWSIGDIKSSLKEANYAVKLAPGDPMPYHTRANAHMMAGNLVAGLADADRAIELAPEAHSLRNTRAYILMQMDRLEEAHAEIDLYLSKDSLAADAHMTRALLYERAGDFTMALLAIQRADSLRKGDPNIQEQLGFFHVRLGNDSLAIAALKPLLDAHPERAFALSCIGLAHARSGKAQEGLKELDRSIKLDDYDPRAFYNRALVYFILGKKEKGCEDLDEAEAIGFETYYGLDELEAARKEHCGK